METFYARICGPCPRLETMVYVFMVLMFIACSYKDTLYFSASKVLCVSWLGLSYTIFIVWIVLLLYVETN